MVPEQEPEKSKLPAMKKLKIDEAEAVLDNKLAYITVTEKEK